MIEYEEKLKYPLGKLMLPDKYTRQYLSEQIFDIKIFPVNLRNLITGKTEWELNKGCRADGWSARQLVHHLADSHMHGLMRVKHALTEDRPVIKIFEEGDWSLLPDYRMAVEPSLRMIEGIHQHFTALFESLSEQDWNKEFIHPVSGKNVTMKQLLATYAWHGRHKFAQIKNAVADKNT